MGIQQSVCITNGLSIVLVLGVGRLDVPYSGGDISEKSRERTNNIQFAGESYIKRNCIQCMSNRYDTSSIITSSAYGRLGIVQQRVSLCKAPKQQIVGRCRLSI